MARPKFLWEPEYLEKLETELTEAGQRHVCLSPVSFRMIADASQMFLWPSRFGLKPGDDVPEQAMTAYEEINNPMCFDELVDAVLQLKSVLEAMNNVASTNVQCCDNLPAPTPDPGIVVDSGAPPPTYGGDLIGDWDEYKERLCGAALAWVDSMVVALAKLDDAVSENLLIVGGIGVLLSLLASPAIGLLVAMEYGLAVGLFSSLVGLATGQLVQDAKDYLIANRQDVADVVFCAGSAEQAATDLRAYLSANLPTGAYDAVVRWFSIENNMNVVYSGTDADGNQVTVQGSQLCSCAPAGSTHLFTFDTDAESWTFSLRAGHDAANEWLGIHPKFGAAPDPAFAQLKRNDLAVILGEGPDQPYRLTALSFDTGDSVGGYSTNRTAYVKIYYQDGTDWTSSAITAPGHYDITGFDSSKVVRDATGDTRFLFINVNHNGDGSNGEVYFDNISVTVDV